MVQVMAGASKTIFVLALATAAAAAGCGKRDRGGDGWHCFAFTYDKRQRVACQESRQACEETKKEIENVGSDLGDCKRSREVFCFQPDDPDKRAVCLPTMDWCERTREMHAYGLMRDPDYYSACGPPDAIPPLPAPPPGAKRATGAPAEPAADEPAEPAAGEP